MLFHNWTPPPIMSTKEKLNTYPPLFNGRPVTTKWQVFHFIIISSTEAHFSSLMYIPLYLKLFE
jgi:hypothetical protein